MGANILKCKYIVFLLFIFILVSANGSAQEKCTVKGNVTIDGGDLNNVKITLYKDSEQASVKSISKNGKFSYQLNFGYDYIFEFSKDDFVTKRISVSTYVPQDVLERDSKFPPCKFSIELFRFFPGIDLSVFDQPIGMIMYNNETDLIETDLSYQTEIEAELKRIKEETRLKQQAYLAEQVRLNSEFTLAVKKGDVEFKKKSYTDAKFLYTKALNLKPAEVYPKDQISKIEDLLLSQKSELENQRHIDEKYNALIEIADKNFAELNYEQAKSNYKSAIEVKQIEKYPKDQLKKIKNIELELKLNAGNESKRLAREKALNDKYDAFITTADKAFELNQYKIAKTEYQSALRLKAEEVYPQTQIQKIDDKLNYQKQLAATNAKLVAEKKALKAEYNKIIKLADSQFKKKAYPKALVLYEKAIELDSDDSYPQLQIQVINEAIAKEKELAANKLKQKQTDAKYVLLIDTADKQLKDGKYIDAQQNYKESLVLKPNESHPKSQLLKIESLIAHEAILLANKEVSEKEYAELIALADSQMNIDEFDKALFYYLQALKIKPKSVYLNEQIKMAKQAKIDRKRELEEKIKQDLAQQAQSQKYSSLIVLADASLEKEDFKSATLNYKQALEYKKGDLYATTQLLKIKNLIAENESQAKAAELLAKKKTILNKQFRLFISEGDEFLKNMKYANALEKYEAALQIMKNDAYAIKQIELVKEKIVEEQLDDEKRLAVKNEYEAYISSGDKLFAEKDFRSAKGKFELALNLKFKNSYPKNKIEVIDEILAKQENLDRKNDRLQKEFEKSLATADSHFKKNSYTLARHHYKEAQKIKPQDDYVKSQLNEISMILKANKRQKENELLMKSSKAFDDNLLKKKEQEYNALIAKADDAIKNKYLGNAKAYYKKALSILERDYPREKLAEIEKLKLAFKSDKDRIEYEKLMISGDKELEKSNYSISRHNYNKALLLATDRSLVKQKLDDVKEAIEQAKLKALDLEYEKLAKKGNSAFKSGNFSVAKFYFQKALGLKPNDAKMKENLKNIKKALQK